MDNHSIFMNLKADIRFNSLSNAVLNTIAGVQTRDEVAAQSIPLAKDELIKSMGSLEIHQAAAVTTGTSEDEDNYSNLDSGCTTLLTNSIHNCREVEEHIISISQAESGVRMMSTHKCRKTYYAEARDGNIHSFEVDALIAPVKQDLIGSRAVILDEDPNICGIYPRINGKLCANQFPLLVITAECFESRRFTCCTILL
jgi:hypothetical protein